MALALSIKPNTSDHIVITTESGERITVHARLKNNKSTVQLAIEAPRVIKINRDSIQARIDEGKAPSRKQ